MSLQRIKLSLSIQNIYKMMEINEGNSPAK